MLSDSCFSDCLIWRSKKRESESIVFAKCQMESCYKIFVVSMILAFDMIEA